MSIILPCCPTDDNSELPVTEEAKKWLAKKNLSKKRLSGLNLAREMGQFAIEYAYNNADLIVLVRNSQKKKKFKK